MYVCVIYVYAAVKRFLIWCAGPDESNGIFFFFSFVILIPPHFFCVHKDSPAAVTAYDCMNVHVRTV